jgi:hypothetical protein
MSTQHYNVMFLCTGNSARSIMAEAIMNRKGRGNFTAYSAGSPPAGIVRPEALKQIEAAGLSTEGNLPGLAGTAFDGPLGSARSCCRRWHASRHRARLS